MTARVDASAGLAAFGGRAAYIAFFGDSASLRASCDAAAKGLAEKVIPRR